MDTLTLDPASIRQLVSPLYADVRSTKVRLMQEYRSYICPLHEIVNEVPARARLLDVGCGHGLLLNLLARLGRIRQGHGFDAAAPAIEVARQVADRHRLSPRVMFEHRSIEHGIPDRGYDAVTIIDVLHHVPDQHKRALVNTLCDALPQGGRLIIKDMVVKPRWRAVANRIHDLVMARQWVEHISPEDVQAWASMRGMRVARRATINTLWYGHWLLVLDK